VTVKNVTNTSQKQALQQQTSSISETIDKVTLMQTKTNGIAAAETCKWCCYI